MAIRFAIAVLVLLGYSAAVEAQDRHWLVGTWQGEVPRLANSTAGPKRIMNVISVASSGQAQGKWGVNTASADSQITVNGDVVNVVNPGSSIEMKRSGDRLEGMFKFSNGTAHPIYLVRTGPFRYAGQIRLIGTNCFDRLTTMEIERTGENIRGFWAVANQQRATFTGKMGGPSSFETQRQSTTSTEVMTIKGDFQGDDLIVNASSNRNTCSFAGTLKKQ